MSRTCRRAAIFILVTVLGLAAQEPKVQQSSLPVGAATIAEFKGEVTLRSPKGETLSPQRGLVLDPETTIEVAKGSIRLSLQDGSEALLKSRSRVVLKAPNAEAGWYLDLLLGKLIAKVKKRLGGAPPFRIGTPSAVITVRGTHFLLEVNKKQRTYVDVYDGEVEVQGLVPGGRSVLLGPGFSTHVDLHREPMRPRNRALELRESEGRSRPGESERPGQEGERQGEDDSRDREKDNHPD